MSDTKDRDDLITDEPAVVEPKDDPKTDELDPIEPNEGDVDPEVVKIPKAELEKLKQAVKRNNSENAKNRLKLKEYEQLGSPDTLAEQLQKLASLPEQEEAAKVATNALLEREREKTKAALSKELEQYRTQADKYKAALQQQLIDNQALSVLSANDAIPDLLMPHIKSRVVTVEDDKGQFAVRVLDNDGEFKINNSGNYATIEDLVKEMKTSEVYGRAFKMSKVPSGGGLDQGKAAEPSVPKIKKADLKTDKDKHDFIKKHGFEAYSKLK